VYVQLIGSDTPLRLTYSKSGFLGAPAWSPHGREIAFTRCDGKNNGVYTVPALGGAERELTDISCIFSMPGPLAWLPDDKGILILDRCSPTGPFGVVLFILATGEKQCLTHSGSQNALDSAYNFSLSPDGGTIAFIASATAACFGDIYTVPLSGGAPHRLTAEGYCLGDFMWTPDSKSIVFVSIRGTLPSLWRISSSGGPMQREATYPAVGSFSKDGRLLAYSEQTSKEDSAIWRADLTAPGGPVLDNRKLIQSQYPEFCPEPSPDGARVVWTSERTGFGELWMRGATGGSPLQLTHLGGHSGLPGWSSDGKWIVFDDNNGNDDQIFIIDADGRNLHPITGGAYDNGMPSWSRDGRFVYFNSKRTGSFEIWKHSLENGAEVQLTRHGGFDPVESYDGQTTYFSKVDEAGIWRMPASGGTESLVVAGKPQAGYFGYWAITQTGLYLLNTEAEPGPRIEFYNFATHRTSPVFTLERKPTPMEPSLGATADGKTIYYTQFDSQSVIKMMEILR
jgi:Tol biopolymer transport system component